MEETLSIRIDNKMAKSLENISKLRGIKKSQFARESLEKAIAVAEFTAIREMLEPYAAAAGYPSEEEIFADIS